MTLVELVQQSKFKTATRSWLHLLRTYFRIKVEGIEHLPRKGRAIIAPNHSGFAGADAVLLTHIIKRETRRRARILAHRAFFDFSQTLKAVSQSFGLKRASIDGGIDILKSDRLMIIFPEGETGNFKPTYRRYELQRFHTGFLRMAIAAQAPIIPCVIIGAEESHLNLGNLKFTKGLRIPLPLNFVPLPAKWRMVFLPPIDLSHETDLLDDNEGLKRRALEIQQLMQNQLHDLLGERKYIYFRETQALAQKMSMRIRKIRRKVARKAGGRWAKRASLLKKPGLQKIVRRVRRLA